MASPRPFAPVPVLPDRSVARRHLDAGLGREAVAIDDRHDPGARRAAVLHARDDLLADVAALVEIDAVQLVHQRLVREGVAPQKILAAFGHAERDAVGVVGLLSAVLSSPRMRERARRARVRGRIRMRAVLKHPLTPASLALRLWRKALSPHAGRGAACIRRRNNRPPPKRREARIVRGEAARPGFGASSQPATTASLSDASSTATLARSL